ncbi:endo-1,3-beta-glucanase Eng2 [Schizosaccharomyces cryophilus OY26]|uniref:glucan endo-1,3-beta-D-glucosidase n=1 Tax=Schizosaccharomyces cryophilus (strain OY26 / ATCC MYA-4695 / CBS 11777 / NBRC 106824 / NRRL Y48691) TaxID=653667 RepID=S9VWD5_SCHCR|nr:endo-1,3-beta-glucanase Eng2 [Schizosaccharomyces cryophilus OY26]EPY51948.1 endo-1,3-beta-glucanase Eng2 [Schizosaccharomyces cryophilus OY26]
MSVLTPIADGAPSSTFPKRDHPLQPKAISVSDQPIQTNKFYGNLFLEDQKFPSFPQPYTLTWRNNDDGFSGLGISHTEASQYTYGPDASKTPCEFYINPAGLFSLIISANEFSKGNKLSASNSRHFSVQTVLEPSDSSDGNITIPIVAGSAFISAVYKNLTPVFNSSIMVKSLDKSDFSGGSKYKVTLNDNKVWLIYAFPSDSSSFDLKKDSNSKLTASSKFNGLVQICKVPSSSVSDGTGDKTFDKYAGVYATGITLSANVSNDTGEYWFTFDKAGDKSKSPLVYALPHHQSTFGSDTQGSKTGMALQSTVMGVMTAYGADKWHLVEKNLPTDVEFLPIPWNGGNSNNSDNILSTIKSACQNDINFDVESATDTNSMYASGKVFAKYAQVCLVASKVLKDDNLTKTGLDKLKKALQRYVDNKEQFPLNYDQTYKGIISTAGIKTPLADYGNTYYNDHHFHYGYHIYAMAVAGLLDSGWLSDSQNEYVNDLIRDAANPVEDDNNFPFFRSFDWFSGHSWSKGLFASGDGKDEESTSEDYNFYYAMKLWGIVKKDNNIINRANLMLAVIRTSMNDYIYITPDNKIQPEKIRGNYCAGITFMNKVDYTTYFGTDEYLKQGIHMIPITPISGYVRTPSYVKSSWDAKIAPTIKNVLNGWTGVLYSNLAITDPTAAWKEFSSSDFKDSYIDNGASKTWYLALAAGMGASP